MKQIILRILQTSINRYLALDPESEKRMHVLSEKIIKIVLPHQTIALQFSEGKIVVLSAIPPLFDLVLTGTPFSFLRFALTKDQQIFKEDILVEGNLELAQEITDLFEQLDIDWEEIAARYVGDVPAYQLGKLKNKISHWNKNFREVITKNLAEYLHEEAELAPSKEALQDFFNDIDLLRMDVDRLEARFKLLQEKWQ